MDEALDSAGWADAAALAPAALAPGDAAALLERCPAVRRLAGKGGAGGGAVLARTCAVTAACLADLQAKADDAARAAALEALAERRSAAASASASQGGNASNPSDPNPSTSHKGRGAPTGSRAVAAAPDPYSVGPDSDDENGGGARGGKGRKAGGKGGKARRSAGKAGKGGAAGDAGPPGGGAGAPRKAQSADAAVAARLLSLDALEERVARWLPEADGAGEAGALCAALAAHVRPGALHEYERALAAVFSAGAEARR